MSGETIARMNGHHEVVQDTPEEMRRFSDWGHVIEGLLIGTVPP